MTTRPKISEIKTLEKYRVTLANAVSQPKISEALAEYGYTTQSIKFGQQLLDKT